MATTAAADETASSPLAGVPRTRRSTAATARSATVAVPIARIAAAGASIVRTPAIPSATSAGPTITREDPPTKTGQRRVWGVRSARPTEPTRGGGADPGE